MSTSIVNQIAALGRELNANHYRMVRLCARYDHHREWLDRGFASPSIAIAHALDIHTSTAREWIRVGHALACLPAIDQAFSTNQLSYAKTRILTRWADEENEQDLIQLAHHRSANRLTTAVANHLAGNETDHDRDQRQHDTRSVTVHTNAEGMIIIRAVLPPNIGKAIAASLNTIIKHVAATPDDDAPAATDTVTPVTPVTPVKPVMPSGASADARAPHAVAAPTAHRDPGASADRRNGSMRSRLRELKRQWQPASANDFCFPSLSQQRADAMALLFLAQNIALTTEIVIHVRGDGTTFDDGTPITNNAVCQRLDQSFIRAMIHDRHRQPIDATNRRRHPTARQKRVALETHNHECVDCQTTDLLELDHTPPWAQTQHTITTELTPRCAPCHRARHRHLAMAR